MIKPLLFITLIILLFSFPVTAQTTGSISGKVIDSGSGESIIGANVIIENTNFGAATDLDGNYKILNIKPGKYNLFVSFLSYTKTKITDVEIGSGKNIVINVSLKPEAIELGQEVIVLGEVSSKYEAALLNQRKKSIQISDGISAEQIKRSTDNTTAEILRRVPGLTLLDNKYIYVRGVSERYNGALLNNSPLASSEPDKKDFAFDLIPANLIENTIVVKSFTPDEPGDFSGGLVKVNTVEFPSETIFSFGYSASYVDNVSTKTYTTYEGSGTDYLGIDNGFRDLPEGFPDPLTFRGYDLELTDTNRTHWSAKLNDKWGPRYKKAFLDQSFSLTFGDRFEILNNDLGIVSSLTYKTGINSKEIVTKDLAEQGYFFDYSGERFSKNVYWGGILNLSYRIGKLHKIGFKNTFTVSSDDEFTRLQGLKYDYQDERIINALRFVSRTLYSGQISGASFIPLLGGLQLDWRGAYSSSFRDEPDYRRNAYIRDIADSNTTAPFYAYIPRDPDFYAGGRFYSYLKEYKRSFGLDLSHSIGSFKIKYGFNHYNSERSFNARLLSVTDPFGITRQSIGLWSLDSLYRVENFEQRYIMMREFFDPSNDYTASDNLFGYFLMAEVPVGFFGQEIVLIAGVRIENYLLRLRTTSSVATGMLPINVDKFNNDALPAFSLIYRMTNSTNIRFSFSRTINRPQFREIAPFVYYNFEDQTLVRGNPGLKQANIANYDLRFETFPDIGELISFSLFLKELRSPIERIFLISTGQNDRTFANASFARNIGFEIEYRTTLGEVFEFLNNFNLTANYSRIWSEIEETNLGLDRTIRPMQGQSPYVINLSLLYQNADFNFSANLSYNRFGKRIIETANFAGDDIYEFPRDMIDFVFTKELGKHVELKLSVKDLLSQPYEYFEEKILVRKYTTNTKLSLGVSYKL